MGLIRSEINRALHRKWFYVFVALGVFFAIAGYIQVYITQLSFPSAPHQFNAWYVFLQVFGTNINSFWGGVIPLLAVIPCGDSLINDLSTGFEMPLMLRVGIYNYFKLKFIANSIIVFMGTVFFLFISLIIALIWRYDVQMPTIVSKVDLIGASKSLHHLGSFSGVYKTSYEPGTLIGLFWHSPFVYVLLVILMNALVFTSVSSIALTATLWLKNRYLVMALPFTVYMVVNVVLQYLGMYSWIPTTMGGSFFFLRHSFVSVIAYWVIPLLTFEGILLWLGPRRYLTLSLHSNETH